MEQVITSADDPWYWTTDQLVDHICRSPSLFRGAGKPDTLPEGRALEIRLRERGVTGDGFLTALDSNGLRTELGIQSLSERLSLVAVIEFLREKSDGYKQHVAAAAVHTLTLGNANAPSNVKTQLAPTNATTAHTSGRKRQQPVQVTMEPPAAHRPQPLKTSSGIGGGTSQAKGGGEWDHLMHWGQGDETTIGINDLAYYEDGYSDDAGDEGQYTGGGAVEKASPKLSDGDRERDVDQTQGPSKLSQDQIVDVINERIQHYTDKWEPNSGVPKGEEVEYDLVAMWEEAEDSGRRQRLIQTYEAEVVYFTQRLDELCDEIMKAPGRTAEHVRQQCRNLEITINSKLLAEWLLPVYKLEPAGDNGEETQLDSPSGEPTQREHTSTYEIIDLGSPSGSSEGDMEEMLVDSSPPPGLPFDGRGHSHERFHTPDSVMGDADLAHTIESPTLPPTQLPPKAHNAPSSNPPPHFDDSPEFASIASARRWRWSDLVESMDRKRIVTKALSELPPDDLETIRTRLSAVGKADMIREIPACIHMLSRNETKISGVLQRDMYKILPFTRLFLCWWLCDNYFRVEARHEDLVELEGYLAQSDIKDPSMFCDYLNKIMNTTFSKEALQHPEQPSQAEIIMISDDEEEDTPAERINRRIKRRGTLGERDAIMID